MIDIVALAERYTKGKRGGTRGRRRMRRSSLVLKPCPFRIYKKVVVKDKETKQEVEEEAHYTFKRCNGSFAAARLAPRSISVRSRRSTRRRRKTSAPSMASTAPEFPDRPSCRA